MAKSPRPGSSSSRVWLDALCGGVVVGTLLVLRGQGQSWLVSILVGVPVAFVVLLLGFLLVGMFSPKQ